MTALERCQMRRFLGSRDATQRGSVAHRLRARRFEYFQSLLAGLPKDVSVLDIGGTETFWESMDFPGLPDVEIVICNLADLPPARHPNIKIIRADARSLDQIPDHAFDVVFSNSVIEHVGSYEDCRAMANEVRRVGRRYFIQTPNRYFPIEPHFMFPCFQFLPLSARAHLLHRLPLAWSGRIPDLDRARDIASSVRLLTYGELRELFPEAEFYRERFLGLVKSYVAYAGW